LPRNEEPTRSIVVAETMHAIISHRLQGRPVDDRGRDRARGRRARRGPRALARAVEGGHTNIHSLLAYAIEEVKIGASDDKPVRVEIEMSNSAGIFQVDEGLGEPARHAVRAVRRGRGAHRDRARAAPRADLPPVADSADAPARDLNGGRTR
jgi:metal-dependent HD superfamily phosphatase/phosphodiesterase